MRLEVKQGKSFLFDLPPIVDKNGVPIDATGFQGRGTIRTEHGGASLGTLVVNITDPSNAAGALTQLFMLPATTAALTFTTPAVFDAEIFSGDVVYEIARGTVLLLLEATT